MEENVNREESHPCIYTHKIKYQKVFILFFGNLFILYHVSSIVRDQEDLLEENNIEVKHIVPQSHELPLT